MMLRAGSAAALALCLAACGGNSEPAAETAETGATTVAEPVAAVAKSGEDVFKKCTACHTIDKGDRNGIGPNLHGIVGAKVASVAGFNYSSAMVAKGGNWDEATLDAYLTAPAKAVPGTKMMFAGISDAAERKALVEYLAAQK